jgi:hypothetical protein
MTKPPMRKRIEFDPETWQALHFLERDSMKTLQELADEAFRDLLRKHCRPVSLKEAYARHPPPSRQRRQRSRPNSNRARSRRKTKT